MSEVVTESGPELLNPARAVFDQDRTCRYLLTRTWRADWPAITWVMLNPSTADAFQLDPTIRRCIRFARTWGAGGIRVVNLFAYRSARPAALLTAADPVGELNDRYLLEACERPALVIAAWGTGGILGGRAAAVTGMLTRRGIALDCLGVTRDGHPRHPLYVPAVTPLQTYRKAS